MLGSGAISRRTIPENPSRGFDTARSGKNHKNDFLADLGGLGDDPEARFGRGLQVDPAKIGRVRRNLGFPRSTGRNSRSVAQRI
jgi:hypothetical protein